MKPQPPQILDEGVLLCMQFPEGDYSVAIVTWWSTVITLPMHCVFQIEPEDGVWQATIGQACFLKRGLHRIQNTQKVPNNGCAEMATE